MRSVKYIALLVAAALLIAFLPAVSLAEPTAYDVWVNGERFTENNAEKGIKCGIGTAVYSAEDGVLTITDVIITKIHEEANADGVHCASVFAAQDLTLEIYGDNTVTSAFSMGHNVLNCGVYCGGTLTVRGHGTLTATGGLSTFKSAGIYARELVAEGDVSINANGGRLTSSVATGGYGIYTAEGITLTDNVTVNACSYPDDSDFAPSVSAAVFSGGTFSVAKNATVSAVANRSDQDEGDALLLHESLSMTGGALKAKAMGENGCGIRIASDHPTPISISSGFLFATGGAYAIFSSYGKFSIHAEYRITGASRFNASEAACKADASTHYDDGLYYVVTEKTEPVPAKSVYFVRPVIEYDLWVGGTRVNNYNCADIFGDGRAVYDRETATLTLNGAQISGGRYENAYLYAQEALTLQLADGSANSLGGFAHEQTESAFGIYAANGLTITGGGTLTIASGDAQEDAFGIYVRIGALQVTGATLQAKAGTAANNSTGIYVASTNSGDLTVGEMASVSGASGSAETMMGISANGNMSVTEASSLSGEGGSNRQSPASLSYGIRCSGAMDMDDSSTVKGRGGDSGSFSIGVYVLSSKEGITIRGGKLHAQSGEGADKCYGLYAKTSVTVKRGDLTAVSGEASDSTESMSYAITGKTVTLSGGTVMAQAGKAASSCGIYADNFNVSGTSSVTSAAYAGGGHALRRMPNFTSYAPVVHVGKEAPGELIDAPTEAHYVNNPYVHIEKLFRSEKVWYALPIYDASTKHTGKWIGFTSDDVTKMANIGAGEVGTGAAEYYNGYIYGVTNTLPFRFWRVKTDGASIGSTEFINDSVRFSFGDMSYDYVTDKMYGLGTYNMERAIYSISLNNGASQRVCSVTGTEAELLTLAFNREGDCYGIDLKGNLYRIYLINGKTEKIGNTGLVPDGAQSMAFDRDTNELFWAYFNGQTGKSGFYYVDISTGKAVNAGKLGGSHMELAGLFTIPNPYDVWIGGVRVNEENAHDVFGNNLVSFDPAAKTLTFNGMKITTFAQAYKNYSFGILVKDMDIELIFRGENAIALDNVYTDYSASICVFNGKAKITGGKLTILSTKARLDNTILCPDGLEIDGCELMIYSNHNAITANGEDADIIIRDSTVGITAGHIGMAAPNGGITIENSTLAIAADKDVKVKACAVAAMYEFALTDSTFVATSDNNVCVISGKNIITESAFEAAGPEQAVSGITAYSHRNGTAVIVSNGKSEESRSFWDKTTPLTSYNYLRISECPHVYASDGDTVCSVCGHIRFVTPDGETYIPGDVDGDSKVTSSDARLALRRSVGLEDYPETSVQYYACDADFDSKVTSADARLILRASVGLDTIERDKTAT